ncbi:hamartin-like [Clytia hemisphaerica]
MVDQRDGCEEIKTYITSEDTMIVKEYKNIIQEDLYSSRGASLLDTLIECFMQTKSKRLVELLIGINDSLCMRLFDKLNENLKHGHHAEVAGLLFSIINKQPYWLHKIVGTGLFATLLKKLNKIDNDFSLLMNGIIILSSLLPCVPADFGPYFNELFEILMHSACLLLKPIEYIFRDTPPVCSLHLHVGVYVFFQRLYSMYPNNFISHMKAYVSREEKKGNEVFTKIIRPLFDFVKLHPDLIIQSHKTETSLNRWKVLQPHDVLAECQRISLDPLDCVKEGLNHFDDHNLQSLENTNNQQPSILESSISSLLKLNSIFSNPDKSHNNSSIRRSESARMSSNNRPQSKLSLTALESGCNPSEVCQMTTPPSSRPISPSHSAHDLTYYSTRTNPMSSDIETGNECHGSIQSLNESQADRKSLNDSQNFGNRSPLMLHKTMSNENVSQRNTLLKSLMSSHQSTPLDKDNITNSRKSTPKSPRRSGSHRSSSKNNRPTSNEFLKSRLGHSDNFDYHSAPTSPMVPTNNTNTHAQFSFNTSDIEESKHGTSDLNSANRPQLQPTNKNRSASPYPIPSNPQNNQPTNIDIQSSLKRLFYEANNITMNNKDQSDVGVHLDVIDQQHQTMLNSRSPVQILDDFIQYGTELNSLLVSRIPMTSQIETDWSHYGSGGAVDEIKILQTQVQMMHTQLQYERYKSEMHCIRNRRLFANLQRSNEAISTVESLRTQLTLTERKLQEEKRTLKAKNDEIRMLKTMFSSRERELNSRISELEDSSRVLSYKLKTTEATKQNEFTNNKLLQKELHKVKNLLFEATEEISRFQPKIKNIQSLNSNVNDLQKQLSVQIHKYEKLKNSIEDFQVKNNHDVLLSQKLKCTQHALQSLQAEREEQKTKLEVLKIKINELENSNTKKDKVISEMKDRAQHINTRHKTEIGVIKERHESCRKTCQSLQSYITQLYSKFDCSNVNSKTSHVSWNNHKCGEKCKKSSTVDGLDVQAPSSHSDHAHHHRHHDNSHRHNISKPPLSLASSATSAASLSRPTSMENPFSQKTRMKLASFDISDSELSSQG